MLKVTYLSTYLKSAKELLSATERDQMEEAIASNPLTYPMIARTGGFRKARWSRGSKGKSGGVRAIFYFYDSEEEIYFAMIYSNNQQENLSHEQEKQLKSLISAIKGKLP